MKFKTYKKAFDHIAKNLLRLGKLAKKRRTAKGGKRQLRQLADSIVAKNLALSRSIQHEAHKAEKRLTAK